MGEGESRVREEARQCDHRKLQDLLAGLLTVFEEGSRSGGSMVSEPPQVSPAQQGFLCVIPRYVRIRGRLKLSRHRDVPTKL